VRERGRAHSPYRRWAVRTIAAVVVVAMVSAGALGAYVWHLNSQIRRVNVDNLTGAGPSGTENILLVGSTNRCGLKTKSPVFGDCAAGVTGVNSDVVMIVHLDNGQHSVSLLSIPRDLFVPNARSTGPGKIDAALAEGPSQLVNVIEQDIGIPINHYVELNFDGFQGVVDALGGVNMYFPEPVYDANSGLDIRTSGCMSLDGFQALSVVRARTCNTSRPT
jgi:LCP family protein required for cell wall assembly